MNTTAIVVLALMVCSCLAGQSALEAIGLLVAKVRGDSAGGSVFDTGLKEAFDASWATCPTVLYDGGIYRMWYSSLYDSKMGRGGIGLASGEDGIHWKRECGGDPVLEIGTKDAFDGGQVMGPEVLFDGTQYRMWYTGMAVDWHRSGLGFYRIGLATSADGIHWRRANEGKPVLDLGPEGAPDEVQAATPSILNDPTGYRMWYAAWSPKTDHRLCVARSDDGIHWERENNGQPVVGLDPAYAYGPAVSRWRGQYLLLYMSHVTPSPGLYAALSRDGIQWSMLNAGKPVLRPGLDVDFDEYLVGHPFLLSFSSGVRVWYTGYRREAGGVYGWKLRIGLAEMREIKK
jgi:hypothetical protein